MGDVYTNPPQSRNEAILRATIDGTEYTAPPQSRIEDLLLELKEAIEQGGTGEGDMKKSIYDSDNSVASAGGIKMFVNQKIGTLPQRVGSLETTAGVLEGEVASIEDTLDNLGTASTKNSTSVVTDSSDLVESGAVYDALGFGNKNKLPYFTEIKYNGGVTVTPNNGRYSFTGIATNAVAIKYPVTTPINSGIYRFIADGYGYIANSNISLYYDDNGTTRALEPNGTIDLSEYTITNIAFFAGANVTVNYQNIGLMLVKESEPDKSFEPYHASVEESLAEKADNSVIAPVEDGATASQAYAVGSHFIRNGAFCTVTSAISANESLVGSSKFTSGDVASCLLKKKTITDITNNSGNIKVDSNVIKIACAYCTNANIICFPFTSNNMTYLHFRNRTVGAWDAITESTVTADIYYFD